MQNPIETLTLERLENDVNVIRHNTPGAEFVAAARKVLKVFSNRIRKACIPQMTVAVLRMQFIVQALSEGFVDLEALYDRQSSEPIR
jgi:hypothetical protein